MIRRVVFLTAGMLLGMVVVTMQAHALMLLGMAMVRTQAPVQTAKAELRNAQGQPVGEAVFTQEPNAVHIAVQGTDLPPGWHGFHIHTIGKCEPPAFTSAGGHFNPAGKNHPEHAGDLAALLVDADGKGWMVVRTERFRLQDLFDADGSTVILHTEADNYAHIPSRYTPPPDQDTRATGDADGRFACGVITRG